APSGSCSGSSLGYFPDPRSLTAPCCLPPQKRDRNATAERPRKAHRQQCCRAPSLPGQLFFPASPRLIEEAAVTGPEDLLRENPFRRSAHPLMYRPKLLMTRAEGRRGVNTLSTPSLWGRASKNPLDIVCCHLHRRHALASTCLNV